MLDRLIKICNLTLHMNILFRMAEEEVVGGAGADLEEAEAGENEPTGKQPEWMGVKLFPPPKSNSRAWAFGGFRKGIDGQLIKSKTVCGICGKEQGYRNSPTNLYQHLVNKHGAQTGMGEAGKAPPIKTFSRIDHSYQSTSHVIQSRGISKTRLCGG